MKYRELGKTGLKVSIVGFGASPLGDVFGESVEAEGVRAVHYAIDKGINYFDVAPMYGVTLAEERLGNALEGKRDSIILATKCCRYDIDAFDFSADRVRTSIDESLKRLKTDYIDIYQIHDIEFGYRKQILEETIPAALEVKKSGKARFVGITGLPVRYLNYIVTQVQIDTILSWGHYNLVEDEMDKFLTPQCLERGIGLINASPLHQRLLTDKGPPSWHRSPKVVLDTVPKAVSVCKKYGIDIADVAMRYALDYPHTATTVVGMSKQRHVDTNIKALDFIIPDGLLDEIMSILNPVHNMMWFEGKPENNL